MSEQEGFEEFDAAIPTQLIETARWLFGKHPAERYGLVLWSHGTGWQPEEIAQVAAEARPDAAANARIQRAGRHARLVCLVSIDAARAAAPAGAHGTRDPVRRRHGAFPRHARVAAGDGAIAETVGQPLELLGMDACLMASLEVAYQIKTPCARSSRPRSWFQDTVGRTPPSTARFATIPR